MASSPGKTGQERIAEAFAAAKSEKRAALMPYMVAGFPDHETSLAVANAYAGSGADLIELGIPYSDPLADGPVIHAAATAALEAGATLDSALGVCRSVADRVPVVLMAYANMIFARGGAEGFAQMISSAGAAGVIVPDLPLEEADEMRGAFDDAGVALIPLVAPTTPDERRARICDVARGFVYLVAALGTTGERDQIPTALNDLIKRTKDVSQLPVAVGFGIGTPQQAARVGENADGVIIGSRLVRAVSEAATTEDAVGSVTEFLSEAHSALC